MSTLRLTGDTSGHADLIPQDISGSTTIRLPNVSGTAVVHTTPATNGQLLIGNTISGAFDSNTLIQGTNIIITNDKGSITIASSDAFAQTQANAAFDRANAAYANANTAIYTAAQIRANISNTTPIRYDATTGIVSHADSGVVASGYGDAATIPVFVANATGHISSVTNTAIAISASQITSGTLAVVRGGTAQTAINGNGSLLIGNTVSGGYDVNTLTQGTGILITNDKGSITIAATGGASANGFGIIEVAGQANVVADQANDTLVLVGSGITLTTDAGTDTLTIQHPASGVTPSGYGDAATVPKVVVDANGHITSVVNTAIAISAAAITSGILAVARGGTGKDATGLVNGQFLIGNTVNAGFDLATIAQTAPVIVVNGQGTVTLSHASSGVVTGTYGGSNRVIGYTVDQFGHITTASNVAIDQLDASAIDTGTLEVVRGGTGQSSYTNGQILIGNTGSTGLDKSTIAQSAPVIVTNLQGSITISHARSGVVALDSYGSQAIIPVLAVDSNGHITAAVNTAIGGLGTGVLTTGILPVARGGTGKDATGLANGQLLIGNTVNAGFDLVTIAQTAPVIVVNGQGTVTLSHASSGVVASGYGDAATVPKVVVDAFGHVTSVVNTAIAISAAAITSGTLEVVRGGTGQSSYTNGQILIGNTGSTGLDKSTIAQTAPVIVTNTQGLINLSHASSGVTSGTYGGSNRVIGYTVDQFGHITTASNVAIDQLDASTIDTGTLLVTRGGTGQTEVSIVNGAILIGNTVSGGYDVNRITQGTGIVITNDKGSISIAATGGSGADQYARNIGNNETAFVYSNVAANGFHTSWTDLYAAYQAAGSPIATIAFYQSDVGGNALPIPAGFYNFALGCKWLGLQGSDRFQSFTVVSFADLARIAGVVSFENLLIRSNSTQPVLYLDDTFDVPGQYTNSKFVSLTKSQVQSLTAVPFFYANTSTVGLQLFADSDLQANSINCAGKTLTFYVQGGNSTVQGNAIVGNAASSVQISRRDGWLDLNTGEQQLFLGTWQALEQASTVGTTANRPTPLEKGYSWYDDQISAPIWATSTVVWKSIWQFFSNSEPLLFDNTSGLFSHNVSGVTATTYGNASFVPAVTVDTFGHVTSVVNTAIAISAAAITSGTLAVARGGTAQTAINGNGSLLIGNTVSGGYDVNTLTQGTGILITNDKGSISISATGGSATDQYARDKANGAAQNAFITLVVSGQSDIVADSNVDTLTIVGSGITLTTDAGTDTLTIQHPASGVTPSGYGDAATVPKFVVDANGHITSVVNTSIAISAAAITSGILAVARGGTGKDATGLVNGQFLIGNTVNSGFDLATIAQTAPVIVVNGQGTVTLSHASSGVASGTYGGSNRVIGYTVDAFGHITVASNVAIDQLDASAIDTGTLEVVRGGTGQSSYTNGQILIGNTGSTGLDKSTIAQSAPVIVTNLQGSITISHARSGVVAATYGSQSLVPVFVVDANGHLTTVTDTAIGGLSASAITTGILAVARGGTGKDATGLVNGQFLIGNTVNAGFDLATIAQTAPVIVVNGQGTVTLSHASSGVVASGYGDGATVPKVVVDAFGHVTSVTNTAIAGLDAGVITTGTLVVARGGTGQSTYTNGQILIGNTGSTGLDKATIAQSAPVIVTNLQGSITISHARSGVVAVDSYGSQAIIPVMAVDANGHLTAVVNTAIGGLSTGVLTTGILPVARGGTGKDATGLANGQLLIGNTVNTGFDLTTIAQTAPVIVVNGKGTITLSHASSGVTATGYGTAAQIPVFVVDAFGHLTSVTNTAIAGLDAGVITTGTLVVARGGTGQSTYTNGQILIGNTGSTGLDKATIAQTFPIIITNTQGLINLSHASSGVTSGTYGGSNRVIGYTVDQFGHLTAASNVAIDQLDASAIDTGTLLVTRGGTGQTEVSIVNGAILIGNTVSGGYDINRITPGTGIVITNDKGYIEVSATGGSAIDQYARDKANGAVQTGFPTIVVATQSDIVADSNTDTLTIVAGTNITLTTDAGTDTLTINATGSGGNGFGIVSVAGQSDVVADQANDTLTLIGVQGITLTTSAALDRVNIAGQPTGNTVVQDSIFFENGQTVTGNYTITTGKSAISAGPISLGVDIVVTIPAGSRWVVL